MLLWRLGKQSIGLRTEKSLCLVLLTLGGGGKKSTWPHGEGSRGLPSETTVPAESEGQGEGPL